MSCSDSANYNSFTSVKFVAKSLFIFNCSFENQIYWSIICTIRCLHLWWLVVRLNDFCLTWEKIGYAWLNALHVFDVHATCSFLLIQKMINKITAFGRPNKVKLFTVFPLIGQCHFHGLYIFYTKIFNRYRYTKPIHAQNARVSCVELVIPSYLNNKIF